MDIVRVGLTKSVQSIPVALIMLIMNVLAEPMFIGYIRNDFTRSLLCVRIRISDWTQMRYLLFSKEIGS